MESLSLNLGSYEVSLVVSRDGSEPHVALKPLCEALGLEWNRQLKKTRDSPQFKGVVHKAHTRGGLQDMFCIPVRQVGMWLCTINARRVNESLRPKIIAFQESLQVVIHDHLTGRLTMERLQQLERVVECLAAEVHALREANQQLMQDNESLKKRLDSVDILDKTLVSNAGRQLAAQRKRARAVN